MRLFRFFFAIPVLLGIAGLVWAQSSSADVSHLHVQLVMPAEVLVPGNTAHAGLYFKLEPGWHIYWKNAGDSGEPPHVKWSLPIGITATPLQFPVPQRLPLGPLMDFGYENEALFPFDVTVAADTRPGPARLFGKVDWLVCREVCIPGKADLLLNRTISESADDGATDPEAAALLARMSDRLPAVAPASLRAGFKTTDEGFRLTVETGKSESHAEFFPADQDIIDNPSPQNATPTPKGFTLDLKRDANLTQQPTQLRGVLTLGEGRAYEIVAVSGNPAAMAAAIVPPAPQKAEAANSATQSAVPPTTAPAVAGVAQTTVHFGMGALAKAVGLAFLGGLILNLMPCVFPVLFLKGLALVQSGNQERHKLRDHGLVYAAGILVSFWALVAVLIGLRMAGSRLGWGFQFQSPVFLSLMAGLLFFLGLSLAGQFEIGISLTSAGGSLAAKQGYTGSFFTGVLAVIVATPCTAPFMGAAIGYALSQPGAVTFAVFTALALGLAAPYVALTMQPAWTRVLPKPGAWMEVLRQAVSVPIFGTVIWLAWVVANAYGATLLAALLANFLLLAVAGWFLGRWPTRRWASGVAAGIVVLVIVLGVYSQELAAAPRTSNGASSAQGAWEPWSSGAVARYQAQGRPVFVDFTANWCLSCQVNERVALERPEVKKAFADANVVLLKADWTQHDEAIADALAKLGRSGVPAYALYVPGQASPQLLPEALTPGIVTDAIAQVRKLSNR